MLEALLSTTDRVVQEIDSVEYGLTDIQEYYANTGNCLPKILQAFMSAVLATGRSHFLHSDTTKGIKLL